MESSNKRISKDSNVKVLSLASNSLVLDGFFVVHRSLLIQDAVAAVRASDWVVGFEGELFAAL